MKVTAIKTCLFKQGDDLVSFITKHVRAISDGSILVVTSKIVALSENRVKDLTDERGRERIIRSESQWAMKTKWTWLTIKDNMVMASAGIDESNADGKIILLPKNSFTSAASLRRILMKHYKIKKFGILITDSRLFPLRAGIVGVALGYAGFKGVLDNRGKKDLFGRMLKMSRVDIADGLATAAVLEMGEAAEQKPLALIEKPSVIFVNRIDKSELNIDFRDDVYLPLFKNAKRVNIKKIKRSW